MIRFFSLLKCFSLTIFFSLLSDFQLKPDLIFLYFFKKPRLFTQFRTNILAFLHILYIIYINMTFTRVLNIVYAFVAASGRGEAS